LVATQAVAETPKMSISDVEVVATQDSMASSTGIVIPLILLVLIAVAVAGSDYSY
jgi:hypothetical protein